MKYVCRVCGWVYDEEAGDMDLGIDPETPFSELPDGFECPECFAGKGKFMESDE